MVIDHVTLDGLAYRKLPGPGYWMLVGQIFFKSGPTWMQNGEWHGLTIVVAPNRGVLYYVGDKKIKWPPTRSQLRNLVNSALELSGVTIRIP